MCVKLGNLRNWFRPGGKMVTWFRENGDNWFEQLGTELKTQQSLVWQLQHSTESRQNAKIKIVPRYLTSFIYLTNRLMIWSLDGHLEVRKLVGELFLECKLTIKRGVGSFLLQNWHWLYVIVFSNAISSQETLTTRSSEGYKVKSDQRQRPFKWISLQDDRTLSWEYISTQCEKGEIH